MIRGVPAFLFTVFLAVMLGSCSTQPGEGGAPPSMMKPFVDFPGGAVIRFRDEEMAHTIRLRENGTYFCDSVGMYGAPGTARDGLWQWSKLSSHHAELMLDQEKYRLSFVSPDSAMAFNEAGGRTFAFQFTR